MTDIQTNDISVTEEKKQNKLPKSAKICIGIACVVAVIGVAIFAFATNYTAFNPEKVAVAYADTIVQSGDGYNAYKYTLVSKNMKYDDFIEATCFAPYINEDEPQADFVSDKKEKTEEETKAFNSLCSSMYNYYKYLVKIHGWDNYDALITNYCEMYTVVKPATYGDKYIDSEYLFSTLEANIDKYAQELKGIEEVLADNGETVVQEKILGKYQELYGEDYTLTATVTESVELNEAQLKIYVDNYKKRVDKAIEKGEAKADKITDEETANNMREAYQSLDNGDKIKAVTTCTVTVTTADGETVATAPIFVVKIGNSWYVDDTNTDTSAFYLAK